MSGLGLFCGGIGCLAGAVVRRPCTNHPFRFAQFSHGKGVLKIILAGEGGTCFVGALAVIGMQGREIVRRVEKRSGEQYREGSPDILLKIKSQSHNQIFNVEGKIRKNYFMIHYTD